MPTTSDLYRGYRLEPEEFREIRDKIAISRNIKPRSAERAIERAQTLTGKDRIKNVRQDLIDAITETVTEYRNQPDERSPEEAEGYVFYYEEEMPPEYTGPVMVRDLVTDSREDAIELAEEYAFGSLRAGFEDVDGDFPPIIVLVTVQYVPPAVEAKVTKKAHKSDPQYIEGYALEGYHTQVWAAFFSDRMK